MIIDLLRILWDNGDISRCPDNVTPVDRPHCRTPRVLPDDDPRGMADPARFPAKPGKSGLRDGCFFAYLILIGGVNGSGAGIVLVQCGVLSGAGILSVTVK